MIAALFELWTVVGGAPLRKENEAHHPPKTKTTQYFGLYHQGLRSICFYRQYKVYFLPAIFKRSRFGGLFFMYI